MSRVSDHRPRLLQRRAEHMGVSVEQMMAEGRRHAEVSRRTVELRSDRRDGWRSIALRAQARGFGWVVLA